MLKDVGFDGWRHEAGERFAATRVAAGSRSTTRPGSAHRRAGPREIGGEPREPAPPARVGQLRSSVERSRCASERQAPGASRRSRTPDARPRDDHEVRQFEDLRIAVPGGNFCERIGTGDEENLRRGEAAAACNRVSVSKVYDGAVEPISRSLATRPATPVDRERRHREPVETRRRAVATADAAAMRDGSTSTRSSASASPRREGRVDVTRVNGIERAAEDADAGAGSHSAPSDSLSSAAMGRPSSRDRATSRHTASSSASSPAPVAADTG